MHTKRRLRRSAPARNGISGLLRERESALHCRDCWRHDMKASTFYRIAAVLILLFDVGHTTGYPWSDPKWGVDLGSMRSTHFEIFGFSRTYWDFYIGFGLFVTVFLLLSAIVAWQLGGLPAETSGRMRGPAWSITFCFSDVAVLS